MLMHLYRNDFILALDKPTKVELDRRLCQGVPDCKETLSKVSILASRVVLPEGLNILPASGPRSVTYSSVPQALPMQKLAGRSFYQKC